MNPKLVANLVLDHVLSYLKAKSFNSDNGKKSGLTFGQWCRAVDDAIFLVTVMQSEVNLTEPVVETVELIDVILLSEQQVRKLAFSVLKASIADENIVALLPFQTSLELGKNFAHIVNESLYTVSTKHHDIGVGDTLCARGSYPRGVLTAAHPTCPGCIAKAKGVIVNHLLTLAKGDHIRVAKALDELQK